MNDRVDIVLLQQYLAGEIPEDAVLHEDGSPVSKDQLESAIKEFEDVALQVEGAALKSHLQDLHNSLNLDKKKTKAIPQRWLMVAASFILIAAFLTIIWQRNSTSSPAFGDYFDHFDQLVTFRDSDSTYYSAGLEAYTKRNYVRAYELLSNIDSLGNELSFYEAVSALGSEKLDSAIVLFEKLGTNSSNKYYQQVKWYLSLAYWKAGKLEKASKLWDSISENEFKYSEAQQLIQEFTN